MEVIKISKIKLKRVLLNSLIFIISLFCVIDFSSIKANAAWYNNAYHFIHGDGSGGGGFGQQTAYYDKEAFWFAQYGVNPTTGYFYQTLGWNVSVYVGNNKYTVGFKTRGNSRQVDENTYGTANLYTLWRIGFDEIISSLERKYPSVDFSSVKDNSVDTWFFFDAIVRVHKGANGWTGDIGDDGATSWGTVYTTYRGLYDSLGSMWGPESGSLAQSMQKLFNIRKLLSASKKPTPPTPGTYATLIEPNRPGWDAYPKTHYHVDGSPDYWVNLRDRFTFYVEGWIPKSYYGTACPDYLYAKMDNGSGQDIRIYAYPGTDQWYGHSGYASNFQSTETSLWTSASPESNYLIGHFRMRAVKDKQTYRFYSMSNKGNTNSGWRDTNQNLKTDGTAPTYSTNPSHKANDVNSLTISQYGIYDSGSGLKYDSVTAKVYKKGTSSNVPEISLNRLTLYADFGKTINFDDYSHLKGQYGEMIVEIWATDNVGNRGMVSSSTVTRACPEPRNHSVIIKEYEYEDSTTKWVKLNDNFKVCNSVEAYKGIGIKGFDLIYDLNKSNPNSNVYFNSWIYNGGMNYIYKDSGFGTLTNNQAISSSYVDSVFDKYSKCIDSVATGANLNGYKFAVWSRVKYNDGVNDKYTGWIKDSKLLGIDGKAPTINWSGNGSTININVTDAESGLNRVEVTINGNKTTYWTGNITVNAGSTITVTSYDNVGNSSTKVIDAGYWDGKYIKTWETTVNGKKVLKYMVDAEIYDYWVDSEGKVHVTNHSLEFRANSSKYLTQYGSIYRIANNSIYYSGMIEDKYNQSYGPTLAYQKNNSTYAKIVWSHIEDLVDNVDLKLHKDGSLWDSVYKGFCSGRKDYKWVLYQTGDRYGNTITKTKVGEGTTAGTEVNMSSYKTGSYEIEVTMYDNNGNPSGTSRLPFSHVQPEINTDVSDLFLKVTAIKDLNWESMTYPIKYNALEFPLGKNKLSNNGEGIKLGYGINFSIENLIKHSLVDYNATYTLLGENGELLNATSNGKNLKDSDRQDGTGYLYQPKSQIIADRDPSPDPSNRGYADRLFFKHFIPADAEFTKPDGSLYRGKVTVRVKIYLKEIGTDGVVGENNYTVDLYTIDTSDSAYDDLNIDKQR